MPGTHGGEMMSVRSEHFGRIVHETQIEISVFPDESFGSGDIL
jgi:hypothetical protein